MMNTSEESTDFIEEDDTEKEENTDLDKKESIDLIKEENIDFGKKENNNFEKNEIEEELKKFIPDKPLVQGMIPQCLSMLSKIGNGLSHAFVKMSCPDMELTEIGLMKKFIHVRYVDVSGNMIIDIAPLNHLTHLLTLKADKNNIENANLGSLPYLQILNLANNRIIDLSNIKFPHLKRLNLNFNLIESSEGLNGKVLTNLQTLELRGNKLDSTRGLSALTNLQNLYIAGNRLTKLEGLESMENLQILHLRDNQIEELEGFGENMQRLQYINLRGNNISKIPELKKLIVLPLLRALVLSDNACNEEDNYRIEVLIVLRRLVRLDKDEFSDEDRADAEDIDKQRKEEEFQQENQENEDREKVDDA